MAHDIATGAVALDETLTLNEIVSRHPEALPILHRYGLDTCCGGAKPLAEVAERHGFDPKDILEKLRGR